MQQYQSSAEENNAQGWRLYIDVMIFFAKKVLAYINDMDRLQFEASGLSLKEYEMMSTAEVIDQALSLKPADRYLLLEMLHSSLDKPDPEIDKVWHEEILRRIKAFDVGRLETVSMEEVFRDLWCN